MCETNLDHDPSVLRDKQIAKSVTVQDGKRHALKVAVGP